LIRDSGSGLDHVRQKLGLQIFSYVTYDEPELISEYMELFTEMEVKIIKVYADSKLSPCAMTFGDIAMENALMHSPEWLKKNFFPRLKRLNDSYHELNIKCLFHSDGYVMEVMDDLIASGIDGLNVSSSLKIAKRWLQVYF
jgi:uroporphyrinogen decarboxylase